MLAVIGDFPFEIGNACIIQALEINRDSCLFVTGSGSGIEKLRFRPECDLAVLTPSETRF